MNKNLKKVLAAVFSSALALSVLAGCNSKGSDKLVMATNAEFPPFEYVEGTDVVGVDADIAKAIADKLDKKLEIQNMKFESALMALSTDKADIAIAGITITDERKKTMDFSDPYTTSIQYMIVLEENNDITKLEDLAGKKIGVQLGTTGNIISDEAVNGYEDDNKEHVTGALEGSGASVVTYKSALEASLDMKNGKVDAVIIDKLPAENISAVNEGLKCFELTNADNSIEPEEYAVAVKKGNTELLNTVNEVIKELKESGKIDEFILTHTGAAQVS